MAEQNKKKVAVVTGASRGIGRAIALELASRGAAVVINYNGSEERAREVQKEIEEKGGEAVLHTCEDFDGSKVAEYDAIAFGCPAMGDEVLEDTEFEPMFDGCKDALKGKNIALFGSYGWGDGEWMRDWADRMKNAGAQLIREEGIIANDAPEDDVLEELKEAGKELAE